MKQNVYDQKKEEKMSGKEMVAFASWAGEPMQSICIPLINNTMNSDISVKIDIMMCVLCAS
jgi:hypothetical protein